MSETRITINGITLSVGQAMTVRVALTTMLEDLAKPDALGDDEHGRRMVELYSARAREVLAMLA